MIRKLLLNSIVFLSAFLLFQIELIISKILLPYFGGSYLVWGACVVFFQAILLLGYYYSHLALRKIGIYKYRYFHMAVWLLPLLFFPGRPLTSIHTRYLPMVIDVFLQLFIAIGIVFFVLSTTSVIFQGWLAASDLPERKNPYILYAVSNLGSFAALLTYPFLFERFFNLDTQLISWRIGYFILVLLYLAVFRMIKVNYTPEEKEDKIVSINLNRRVSWFLLGASGVILFLAVTNIITSVIAPIPLLWVVPLCLYLVSFVLNFKEKPWYPRWIKDNFYTIAGFSALLFFFCQKGVFPLFFELIGYLAALFFSCMFCQGKLYSTRPLDKHNLTLFYLIISLGSFFGGMLVSWVFPLVSTSMIEYLCGLFLISLALVIEERDFNVSLYNVRLLLYLIFTIILWPLIFKDYNIFALILILIIFKFVFLKISKRPSVFCLSLLSLFSFAPVIEPLWVKESYIYKHRNYYGIYKIFDKNDARFMVHGTIIHGAQHLTKNKAMVPIGYYHPLTPVGELLRSKYFPISRIAVIGLGSGALSVYLTSSQEMDFFEIDPDVYSMATKYFTYIDYSSGKKRIAIGDARLTLDKVNDKQYDFLIVDAFSGDSIPAHLLTTEAIAMYRRHLTKQGLILFHVSNKYLKLEQVLFKNAGVLGAYVCSKSNKDLEDSWISNWVALTWDYTGYKKLVSLFHWGKLSSKAFKKKILPWTDKYTNIVSVIKLNDLFNEVKEFQPFSW